MIHPNGSPFSWYERSQQNMYENSVKNDSQKTMKFIQMLISLFK